MNKQVIGVGTDIIAIERIKSALERHGERFLDRLFTSKEKAYCGKYANPVPNYAGRFAAKEAVLKALGTGLVGEMSWQEIEIINDPNGKPEVHLSKRLQKLHPTAHFFISISHCDAYATATAILTG